jgi:hypothetical protein
MRYDTRLGKYCGKPRPGGPRSTLCISSQVRMLYPCYIYIYVALQSCSIICVTWADFKTLLTRQVLNSLAQHCFLFLRESRKFESLFIFNSVHWLQLKMKLGLCLKNDIFGHLLSLILICRKFSFTFDFLCLLAFVGLCI